MFLNTREKSPVSFFVVILIACGVLLATPVTGQNDQDKGPEIISVEIKSSPSTFVGYSLYTRAREPLAQDWERLRHKAYPVSRGKLTKSDSNYESNYLVDAHRTTVFGRPVLVHPGYSILREGEGMPVSFYKDGDNIEIHIVFNRAVIVSATPKLLLLFDSWINEDESKVTSRFHYGQTNMEGNDTLIFTYTVQSGDDDFGDSFQVKTEVTEGTYKDINKDITVRYTDDAGSTNTLAFGSYDTDLRIHNLLTESKNRKPILYDAPNEVWVPPIPPDDAVYLRHLIDTINANVRITGLITEATHDANDFLKKKNPVNFARTDARNPFAVTDPMADVEERKTQRYPFDVEIRFFNYGVGGRSNGVVADDTRGFEAEDISITGKDGAVVTRSEWDVALTYIGMDHRDPGFPLNNKDDMAQVKHSAAFKVYKATISPPAGFEGSVEIKVPAGRTEDIARNVNEESNTLSVPIDTPTASPPRISITETGFPDAAPPRYNVGDHIDVEVTFNIENARTSGPRPYVTLYLGRRHPDNARRAKWQRASEVDVESTKVTFRYTVQAGDDTSRVSLGNSVTLPRGSAIYDSDRDYYYSITDNPLELSIPSGGRGATFSDVAMDRVIFNELRNAREDKNDWLELKNISDTDVSLKAWQISLVTGQSDAAVVAFPDYTLPPGGILLIVNTDPGATDLARGQNIASAASKGGGVATQYFVASSLKLPSTPYLLLLRSASDKTGKPEAFEDVLGTYFRASLEYATQVWPLRETTQPENAAVLTPDEAWQRKFEGANVTARGYAAAAWRASGYQAGLGYDAKASERSSLGTPGYPNAALVSQSGTGQISVSEVMFSSQGGAHSLPQWIELYNNSSTDAVNLAGWELEVALRTAEGSPRTGGFTFETLHVLPNQTVLLVTYNGRHSGHLPDARIYNLATRHGAELQLNTYRNALLSANGFSLKLSDTDGTLIDAVGNLGGDSAPAWDLPSGKTADGHRTSLLRRYDGGTPRDGTAAKSWVLASDVPSSSLRPKNNRNERIYWGHPQDVGSPGYRSGGPLPVALSAFLPKRTADAVVIKWATQSELDNAGFNLLRSESKTGAFKVINPTLIRGAGTSGERHLYQYTDKTAKPGVVYYYQLEEVSFAGVRETLRTARLRGEVSAGGKLTVIWGNLKKLD